MEATSTADAAAPVAVHAGRTDSKIADGRPRRRGTPRVAGSSQEQLCQDADDKHSRNGKKSNSEKNASRKSLPKGFNGNTKAAPALKQSNRSLLPWRPAKPRAADQNRYPAGSPVALRQASRAARNRLLTVIKPGLPNWLVFSRGSARRSYSSLGPSPLLRSMSL